MNSEVSFILRIYPTTELYKPQPYLTTFRDVLESILVLGQEGGDGDSTGLLKHFVPKCQKNILYANLGEQNKFKLHLGFFFLYLVWVLFIQGSHISQAGFKFTKQLRITLNFRSSCLHLPSAVITDVHHHAQFVWYWVLNPELPVC